MPENLFSKLDENSKSLRVKAQEFACAIKALLGEQYGSVKSLCDELEKMNDVVIDNIGDSSRIPHLILRINTPIAVS